MKILTGLLVCVAITLVVDAIVPEASIWVYIAIGVAVSACTPTGKRA